MRARSTAASVWPARTMHAAGARPQRKHVARAARDPPAASPDRSPPAPSPRDRRPRCRCVVAPLGFDRHAERRLEARAVLRHHQRNLELVEPLRRHRQADQAAAVARHEVDRLRRDLLGGDRQVALVLAILVVDDDDHPAGADRRRAASSIARERRRRRPRAFGDGHMSRLQCVTSPRSDAERQPGQFRRADDVLADHVAFEVDPVADLRRAAGSCARSVNGTICTSNRSLAEAGHGQADAVDGDRSLVDDVAARAAAES